jgi:glycine dehydrogenase subunit 1
MATHGACPYTPHTADDVDAMLDAVGAEDLDALFPVPDDVPDAPPTGIEPASERETRARVADTLAANDDLVSFYGRGHHDHYVPSAVESLSKRSEFLTSYTQYQPEVAQGFLQALFEYQSICAELTGLRIVNASMYDHASALGEAALLSARVTGGERVLVPEHLRAERRSVLENFVAGADMRVESYPMADGAADVDAIADRADDDCAMVYVESPTVRGVVEPRLSAVADAAHAVDATCCLGSDPVALSLLERPADAGCDIVIGDAGALGLPQSYGMGLGLFAARDDYLRQIPGRLVGASRDANGRRAFTLTLQTREQHIRKERATSNICTNQAWAALRTAMHAAWLGPDGLVDLADDCVRSARDAAARLDAIEGVTAPVHDRHHVREFVAEVADAPRVADRLLDAGYGVHALGDDVIQCCVAGRDEAEIDGLVEALAEVAT